MSSTTGDDPGQSIANPEVGSGRANASELSTDAANAGGASEGTPAGTEDAGETAPEPGASPIASSAAVPAAEEPPAGAAPADPSGVGPTGASPGHPPAAAATVAELTHELAAAEAERDALAKQLDKRGRRGRWRRRARQYLAGFLVVVFAILLPVTYVVTWAHNTVLNTDNFVSTLGPVASNPAVTAAASAEITDQIFASLNPQQIVASSLPPRAAFLAGPVTNAAKGYIQTAVNNVLQSQQFQTLWQQALRLAHSELVSALEGHSKALTNTNGQVVLNLVPLLNSTLQQLQGFVSGVVGSNVKLPTITANEVPSTACMAIANALNRPVPDTCGQIVLFPADKLTQAQHLVRAFNRITVLLLILTPVVAALALWVSRRRRRTLLQLTAGGFLGLVVIRRVVIFLENTLANTGAAANRDARRAILTQLFNAYFSVSRWVLLGLIVVFVVALVTGPYGWARAFRRTATHWGREGWNVAVAAAGHARDDSTIEWIGAHLDLLRVLGIAVAVILLLALSVSWVGLLVIIVLLAAYELWLHRLGQRLRPDSGDGEPPPGEPGSGAAADQTARPSSDAGAASAV
jgi:hypothetical protein